MNVPHETQEIDLAALRWMRAALVDGSARTIRQHARISTVELAAAVGVTPQAVIRWEGRKRVPRGQAALRYAAALLELQSEVAP